MLPRGLQQGPRCHRHPGLDQRLTHGAATPAVRLPRKEHWDLWEGGCGVRRQLQHHVCTRLRRDIPSPAATSGRVRDRSVMLDHVSVTSATYSPKLTRVTSVQRSPLSDSTRVVAS